MSLIIALIIGNLLGLFILDSKEERLNIGQVSVSRSFLAFVYGITASIIGIYTIGIYHSTLYTFTQALLLSVVWNFGFFLTLVFKTISKDLFTIISINILTMLGSLPFMLYIGCELWGSCI